jgi:DNA-binding GntR family transcriptional regulator
LEGTIFARDDPGRDQRNRVPPLSHPSRPLGYSTKSELVYRYLREMIVNGRLQPGEHLYLHEVAEQLQVSTNPVREALRRLESEGLVINRPHAGATVAALDVEKIEVHFMIRAALEGLAVRLACAHATDEALARLEELDRQLRRLAAADDLAGWNEANIAFHRFLFDCSGSPELVGMIDLQRDRSPRFRHFPDVLAQRAREADGPRAERVAAVRARDGERAEGLHRAVVTRTGQLLCAAMRQAHAHPGPDRAVNPGG